LRKVRGIPYNSFFMLPLIIWVVAGGILLCAFSQRQLFAAINTHYTPILDTVMEYATMMGQVEVIIPTLMLLLLLPGCRNLWYFVTATLCNLAPLGIQQLLKSWFDTPRPLAVYHSAKWMHLVNDWPLLTTRSFPSGHSQGAFSFFCFLSLLLPARYRRFGLLFCLLGLLTCYSRIYLAAHFFADVYAGSIVGVVSTSLIFAIMYKYKRYFFRKGAFNE
jgi:membrane-associated phospholipid phosphatase